MSTLNSKINLYIKRASKTWQSDAICEPYLDPEMRKIKASVRDIMNHGNLNTKDKIELLDSEN